MRAHVLVSGAGRGRGRALRGLVLAVGLALAGAQPGAAAPLAGNPPTAIAPVAQSAPDASAATLMSRAVEPLGPGGRAAAVAMLVALFAGLAGVTVVMWRDVTRGGGPPRRR